MISPVVNLGPRHKLEAWFSRFAQLQNLPDNSGREGRTEGMDQRHGREGVYPLM
jgi:hypothetical protein